MGSSTIIANTMLNVPIMTTPCGYSSASLGQWYRLIPGTGGVVTLNTAGSNFDTTLSVVRLTASGFVVQACNDDANSGLTSLLSFSPQVGIRYYLVAGGYNGAVGSLHLAITNAAGGGHTPGPLPATPPVNHAPTVAAPIADQGATAGTLFTFVVPAGTFGDPDFDSLTYAALQADDSPLPAWLTFDATTRTFDGTPAAGDVATLSIKVTATDPGALSATDTFDIVVAAAPPTTGTIEVVKHLVPSSDPGTFDLSVDGTTVPDLGDGGTTGPITVGRR